MITAPEVCHTTSGVFRQAEEAETVAPDTKTYQVTITDEPEAVSFDEVEVKPTFRDGDPNAFAVWVNSQLVYPEKAITAGTQGRVVLSFVVDTDGSVTDVQLLRGVDPDLDAEALRVVSSCTEKWTPGMKNGKPVRVTYTFPIVFKLK